MRTDTVAASALDAYLRVFYRKARIELPDVCTGIVIKSDIAMGAEDASESGSASASGTSGSVSLSLPASSEGSAAFSLSIYPIIKTTWNTKYNVKDYYFLMPAGASMASIRARANGALDMPTFKPEPLFFALVSQSLSVGARASARASRAYSSSGTSVADGTGTGGSQRVSTSNRVESVRPTIHAAFSLTGTASYTQTVSVTAAASVGPDSSTRTVTGTITASVSPSSVAATDGATALPTSGEYIEDIDMEPFAQYPGYNKVRVTTVTFPLS